MPSLRCEAPSSIPDEETIEQLLGRKNNFEKRTKSIKTITELSDDEKTKANLVTLGKRQTCIEGDPFGVYPAWAGNVGHPRDVRMVRKVPDLQSETFSPDSSLARCLVFHIRPA